MLSSTTAAMPSVRPATDVLRELFPLLADGGWYFIEDLDWQPPGEDAGKITPTKTLLREIQAHGAVCSIDPFGIGQRARPADSSAEILFFDSHYELNRAKLLGGLAAIRKTGGSDTLSAGAVEEPARMAYSKPRPYIRKSARRTAASN